MGIVNLFYTKVKSKYDNSLGLSMGGKCLHYSDNMMYLGIKFGKRLTWADHTKSRGAQVYVLSE